MSTTRLIVNSVVASTIAIVVSGCGSASGPTVVSKGERGVATKEVNGVKTLEYITCDSNTNKKIVVSDIRCKSSGCEKKSSRECKYADVIATLR